MPTAKNSLPGGLLTPEEMASIGRRLYGKRSWRNPLARALGVERSTVSRWLRGLRKIDGPTTVSCRWLLEKYKQTRVLGLPWEGHNG